MEETLGNHLRKTRESAGITVDDAVYLAKIPRAVVEALEAEDFGFFTSPLYARSFLLQYSEYIGADVGFWSDSFVPATMIDGEAVESFIDISEPVAKAVTKEQARTSGGGWAAVWMVAITAGLVWGGFEVFRKIDGQFSVEPVELGETVFEPDDQPTPAPSEEKVTVQSKDEITNKGPEPPKRAIIVNLPEE